MPPQFKSALANGHVKPAAAQARNAGQTPQQQQQQQQQQPADDATTTPVARATASFVEKLFPDKFGGGIAPPNSAAATAAAARPTGASGSTRGGGNNNKSPAAAAVATTFVTAGELHQQQLLARAFNLGMPTGFLPAGRAKRAANARRAASAPRIAFGREMVRKSHPVAAIPASEKAGYWFTESATTVRQTEVVSMPIGRRCIFQQQYPTKIHVMAWGDDEAGASTGRVTLYVAPIDRNSGPAAHKNLIAVGSLRPFVSSTPLKLNLPAAPAYMVEVRCANPKLQPPPPPQRRPRAGDDDDDDDDASGPRVLLLMESQSESFGLV